MIKTSAICVSLVILVLFALPFGAQAADSLETNNERIVITLGANIESADQQRSVRFTTIQQNGDMRGVDKDGNRWTFDSKGRRYQNIDTGKTCYGKQARSHCSVR